MQYLLQNKINYLSSTKVVYTGNTSIAAAVDNFIIYNSDVNSIQRFNYNYVQQSNRTSFDVFSLEGPYKVNNIIYTIRLPFICNDFPAIKDEDTVTLNINVDGTIKQYVYPLQKQYVNTINFIDIEHICKEITSINITATSTVNLTLLRLKNIDGNGVTACSIIFV